MPDDATPRPIDFTNVEGPAPTRKKPKRPIHSRFADEVNAKQRAPLPENISDKRRDRLARLSIAPIHSENEIAYKKRMARLKIQEEIEAGTRKPFYGRRKSDPSKPTMYWLDKKEK